MTAAALWPSLGLGFFWDDRELILANAAIRGLGPRHLAWMLSSRYMLTWQPLGWLAYAVVFRLQGLQPSGFHAATLAAHAAAAAALFLTLRELVDETPAALASLCFALHPLQALSAAWPTELPDILATALFLLSLKAYLRGRLFASWLWFFASCLCRWKGVCLPVFLAALDVWPLRRRPDLRRLAPFLALSLVVILINAGAKSAAYAPSVSTAALSRGLALFAWKILAPWRLLPVYAVAGPIDTLGLPVPAAAAVVAALTAWALRERRRRPWLLGAWCCYAAALAPPLLHSQGGATVVYPHHGYLAGLPWYALLAGGLDRLWKSRRRAAVAMLALGVLAGEAVLSRAEIAWRADEVGYWKRALALDPSCRAAYDRLGDLLIERGRLNEAAGYVEAQLRVSPSDPAARENLRRLEGRGYRSKNRR